MITKNDKNTASCRTSMLRRQHYCQSAINSAIIGVTYLGSSTVFSMLRRAAENLGEKQAAADVGNVRKVYLAASIILLAGSVYSLLKSIYYKREQKDTN